MAHAAMPQDSYSRPPSLVDDGTLLAVEFRPEGGGTLRVFRFDKLPGKRPMQVALAEGFARVCGPGGTRRTEESAQTMHSHARTILRLLSSESPVPGSPQELRPVHLHELRLKGSRYSSSLLQSWRSLLRGNANLTPQFREALYAPLPLGVEKSKVSAYSEAEYRQIRRAARSRVRQAVERVRAAEGELAAWRTRDTTEYEGDRTRGALLDHIAHTGDVPRDRRGMIRHNVNDRGASQAARDLFPSFADVAALTVLMICATGHNLTTVLRLPAAHLRADDQLEETRVTLVRASKPRRGPERSEMDLAFVGPDPVFPEKLDLESDFGLHTIATELCRRTRHFAGSDLLLVAFSPKWQNSRAAFRPLPQGIFEQLTLLAPDGTELPRVDARRLRRFYLLRHQKPVGNTEHTLADHYQRTEPASVRQSRVLVSETLDKEVKRLKARSEVITLSPSDLESIAADPGPAAARLGIGEEQLRLLAQGQLDTVATACVDNTNGPNSAAGSPCTASFLLCLGCPNARSEPRHFPVQALLSKRLRDRRIVTTEAEWNTRFRTPDEQLTDLLQRQQVDVEKYASLASKRQEHLVELLLDGKLDLR